MIVTEKYLELVNQFPPRPIVTDDDLEMTQEVMNQLLDKSSLTPAEEDYLEVLGTLVYNYEQKQGDLIPDIYGVDLLKVLMEEHNLKQKNLVSIFKTESIISDILKGKRQLTNRHIQELAEFFHVSPAVFFPIKSIAIAQ
ncbi:transcriptional regulator [Geminocystis sp. GBBB08]|uniref:helix-turn-helix domain-containing protein n=1 Tax=Geminocystis sp. GBBB08 TaxID=2604140 RepID=UPI0027E2C6EB|nr:transcriptional regulator [Geminocystis sp. GBBB08]MBL1208400.1 transcriptional regulator [Geminocystis sp. GBBB08]